ncbi:MAG: hypothetical protein Q8O67_07725 [Deltaproteobacteria bacterium]|nr:hypothetical protein [Deltaproteobacteria bacterium]
MSLRLKPLRRANKPGEEAAAGGNDVDGTGTGGGTTMGARTTSSKPAASRDPAISGAAGAA